MGHESIQVEKSFKVTCFRVTPMHCKCKRVLVDHFEKIKTRNTILQSEVLKQYLYLTVIFISWHMFRNIIYKTLQKIGTTGRSLIIKDHFYHKRINQVTFFFSKQNYCCYGRSWLQKFGPKIQCQYLGSTSRLHPNWRNQLRLLCHNY